MKLIKAIFKILFSRIVLFTLAIAIQVLTLLAVYYFFHSYITYFYALFLVLGFLIVLDLLNNEENPMFKIAWIIPLLLFPIFGIIMYIFLNYQFLAIKMRNRLRYIKRRTKKYFEQDQKISNELYKNDKEVANLANYMYNCGPYPIYKNTDIKFFKIGEEWYTSYLEKLRQAREYIFLEYFIVARGMFWSEVLDILIDKVKEGVEVYFLYDGMCSLGGLPYNYAKKMRDYGIKCKMFNKVVPVLSTHQNNRDHRKITVIDGFIAFTGGTNISDEYINKISRFGYWKDTTIMLTGDAVKTFVILFLQMWNITESRAVNYDKYLRNIPISTSNNGYVLPYGDSPLDDYEIGKNMYLDLINTATKYVHITTPYLIPDYEVLAALKYAARRGVEVIIIMPHIPDKWYTYILSRSYYHELLHSGVRIVEYSRGFIHAKEFITDDVEAVVGSINLDYRSLYSHFEDAVYMYKSDVIKVIEKDFEDTLKECEEVTIESNKKYNKFKKLLGYIFRLFAPLM